MSVVADVQEYLAALDIVDGSSEWPSVRRRVHDNSNQLVVITEDGGPAAETPADAGIGLAAFGFPQVQCRVRGEPWDGDSSHAKAEEIRDALHGLQGPVMGSTQYIMVTALTSGPVFLGFDDKGRPEHTISFQAVRGQDAPLASI